MSLDIVIAGVGGQGTVLASRIIASAAMRAGEKVFTSETIGMAQREGSVVSQVRIGEPLYGPQIPDGKAEILLGLELAEAVRALPKLKPGGMVIVNSACLIPPSVARGESVYDREALQNYLREKTGICYLFDAFDLAREAGNVKSANVVMLGAFSCLPGLPFTAEQLLAAVLAAVPPQTGAVNEKAFALGRQVMGGK
ncbi:MAG: indolepyruvate ferredoxin oxidoreductase, beta subunit [Eubacteriales bacterium]|nr:indolepyruvate ferredoxin oxidoreductase, beta subunit [Eubacteriales bacterium]